jgi:hypothetical protein
MPTYEDDSVAVPSTENAKSNSDKLSKHFARHPSPQVALQARLALHRSALRPSKEPGSLHRSVASTTSSPFSAKPSQAWAAYV